MGTLDGGGGGGGIREQHAAVLWWLGSAEENVWPGSPDTSLVAESMC